jgi:biopolymer transport protein ExbB
MGFSALRAGGPVIIPLLLLSIVVVAIGVDRFRYWRRVGLASARQEQQLLEDLKRSPPGEQRSQREALHLRRLDAEMAQGENVLEAATLIGPLLGLIGTVSGLMRILADLGPQLSLPSGGSVVGYGQVLVSTVLGLVVALIAVAILRSNQALRQWRRQRLELASLQAALEGS